MSKVCVACGGTRVNSRGGPCVPCQQKGGVLLADVARDALEAAIELMKGGAKPTILIEAMRWVVEEPRVTYAAGYKRKGQAMGMFAGPVPSFVDIKLYTPDPGEDGTPYIIKLTRLKFTDEPTVEPVARWNGKEWQMKPTK